MFVFINTLFCPKAWNAYIFSCVMKLRNEMEEENRRPQYTAAPITDTQLPNYLKSEDNQPKYPALPLLDTKSLNYPRSNINE